MRISFRVSFNCPEGASIQDCQDYVRYAVCCWKNGLDYENDPMAQLNKNTLSVKRMRNPLKRHLCAQKKEV